MSGAAITFDGSDAIGKIDAAAALLRSRRVLEIGGEAVLGEALDAFRNAADPATGSPWKPLRPNTVAARRKGSSSPLLNTGVLRASFGRGGRGNIWREGTHTLAVGSAHKTAVWHHEGTKPYTIVPRNRKWLRFVVAGGGGKARRGGGGYAFARKVHHPGLPARPMLGVSALAATRIEALMKAEMERALA